jgi:glycosyltransferase involved in cell wall biosynthesis
MPKSKKRKKNIKSVQQPIKKAQPQMNQTNQGLANPVPGISKIQKQTVSLCLVMIVKDEANNIRQCLSKVAPFIDYWVIVDTGSKDNTIQVIKETMEEFGVQGEMHERPWVNFEVNRTESLELAKGKCDYRWIIDADDTFEVDQFGVNPFIGLDTTIDTYQLTYRLNALQYHRAQIVKSNQDWVYKGVLHEYLHCDQPDLRSAILPGCHVKADISPLKRASSLQEKYANDAKILEKALIDEPDNTRYMFYLAQSYRDSDQFEKAIEAYKKRAQAGEWDEEVYYSLYMVAKIMEKTNHPIDEVIVAYSKAWEYRPQRLEAVFHVMRKLREQNRFVLAFTYGDVAVKTPGTKDILFVEPEIWQWRLLDEYSIAAYYIGHPELSYKNTKQIIDSAFFSSIHPQEQDRLRKNLEFYSNGLNKKKEGSSQLINKV